MINNKHALILKNTFLLLLFLVGFGVNLNRARIAFSKASVYASNSDYDAHNRPEFWLKSAQVMQESRIFLAIRGRDGIVSPVEDYSLADDPGNLILVNALAYFKKTPVDQSDLTKINTSINTFGILALAFTLFLVRHYWSGAITLFVVGAKAIPGPIPGMDVFSAYIGIVGLALVPVVWISSQFEEKPTWQKISMGLFSLLCLACAATLRQPIGLIGILCSVLAIIALALHKRIHSRREYVLVGCAVMLVVSSLFWARPLLLLRNKIFHLPPPIRIASHGISHALYLGLGTEENPWGIDWADTYGLELVQKMAPNVPYASSEYFQIMRNLFLNTVARQPTEVLKIYFKKFKKCLALPFKLWGIPIFYLSFFLLFLLPFLLYRSIPFNRSPLLVNLIVALFMLLFLLQGILGIPWAKHLYPSKVIVILQFGLLADYFWLEFRRLLSSKTI